MSVWSASSAYRHGPFAVQVPGLPSVNTTFSVAASTTSMPNWSDRGVPGRGNTIR